MADSTVLYFEDSDGNEIGFELIGAFPFEERQYAVLFRLENPEPSTVNLLELRAGENDEAQFYPIEDAERYERVAAEFDRIFNDVSEEPPRVEPPSTEDEDFCYQDDEGRLFVLDDQGNRIYLNEFGEPIEG